MRHHPSWWFGGLRRGLPEGRVFDDLDPEVATCRENARELLEIEGVTFVPLRSPKSEEIHGYRTTGEANDVVSSPLRTPNN